MNIGLKIKEARKAQGLSQSQLGGEEFTKGYISQIEKGSVKPSMNVLTVISEKLKLPISYFLNEECDNSKEFQKRFISGKNIYNKNNYEQAEKIFNNIVSINHDVKSSFYCMSLLYQGKCKYYMHEYDDAIDILTNAIKYINEIDLCEELSDCYNYLGHCYFDLYNYNTAIEKFNNALEIMVAKDINIPEKIAKLFLNIGSAYSNMGNFNRALEYFNKDIAFCRKNYIADTLLDCYVRMGYCSYKLGIYEDSDQYLLMAVSINKSLDSKIVSTEINNMFGLVYAKQGKINEGFNFLSKSMEISSKVEYEFGYNMSIVCWTYLLIDSGKISEAESYALNSIDQLKDAKDKLPLYYLLAHLGHICILKDDIENGKKYLEAAIKEYSDKNLYWEAYYYSKLLADAIIETYPQQSKYYYNFSIECLSKMTIK